jgi:hypothetical protein
MWKRGKKRWERVRPETIVAPRREPRERLCHASVRREVVDQLIQRVQPLGRGRGFAMMLARPQGDGRRRGVPRVRRSLPCRDRGGDDGEVVSVKTDLLPQLRAGRSPPVENSPLGVTHYNPLRHRRLVGMAVALRRGGASRSGNFGIAQVACSIRVLVLGYRVLPGGLG